MEYLLAYAIAMIYLVTNLAAFGIAKNRNQLSIKIFLLNIFFPPIALGIALGRKKSTIKDNEKIPQPLIYSQIFVIVLGVVVVRIWPQPIVEFTLHIWNAIIHFSNIG